MKYIKQLDSLRFMAIFFVLLEHFPSIISRYISAGYYGVDLFFVLSGFLITGILLRYESSFGESYKKFIGRRTLRIFPLYYLFILILFLANNPTVQNYFFYFLTYTANYKWIPEVTSVPGNMLHVWSLCVEEQFYLIWPFLILGLRQNLKVLKILIILLIIICLLQYYYEIIPAFTPYNFSGIIPRGYSLAMGGLGAILLKENKINMKILEKKWIEFGFLILLIVCVISNKPFRYGISPLVSLFLVLKTTHKGFLFAPINKFFNNSRIIYFGTISYGIYLFHVPIEYYFGKNIFNPIWEKIPFETFGRLKKLQWHSWVIKFPLYTFLSIFLAHLSYKYFERPFLFLKDRYFKY